MIPLLKKLWASMLYDELAATRWLRGTMAAFALSGVTFAQQIATELGAPRLALVVKGLAIVCGFISVAITAGQRNKEEKADVTTP